MTALQMQDFNDELQGWVLHHISPITPGATGIGTIDVDAAQAAFEEALTAINTRTSTPYVDGTFAFDV